MRKDKRMKKIAMLTAISIMSMMFSVPTFANRVTQNGVNQGNVLLEKDEWKEKISEELYKSICDNENSKEKLDVCIWYSDIEQQQIEKTVEDKTGLSKKKIGEIKNIEETELFKKIADLEINFKANLELTNDFSEYLNKTERLRAEEGEIVEKYMSAWCDECKQSLKEKVSDIKSQLEIKDSEISFESKYAPMIITKMTYQEIKESAKCEDVETIDVLPIEVELPCEGESTPWNSMENMKSINGFEEMYKATGLSGKNVLVGVIEGTAVDPTMCDELSESKIKYLVDDPIIGGTHVVNTVRIINGKKGIAPDSTIYSVACDDYIEAGIINAQSYCRGIEALMDKGVSVINSSFGFKVNDSDYNIYEKWIDYLINSYGVTVVVSAGNNIEDGERITTPGLAYNVITVGAMYDGSTTTTSDDTAWGSSYNNWNGCEKPDIIAPANVWGGGTSSAAPVVTGLVALLFELKPSLALYPQAVKAILMASCHRKVMDYKTNTMTETMEQGLTDVQGAGVINPYIAVSIVGQGQYGVGEFSSGTEYIGFAQPKYGSDKMNISVNWLQKNIRRAGIDNMSDALLVGAIQNVDMEVYRGNSLVAESNTLNSSAEMAYVNLYNGASNFRIKLTTEQDDASICYGYAWSTNYNQLLYQAPKLEGIYFLRNKDSGLYLKTTSSAGDIYPKQYVYSSGVNQMWIIRENYNGTYKINSANNINKGMLSNYSETSDSVVLRTSGTSDIDLYENGDGTYRILLKRIGSSIKDALSIRDFSTSIGASVELLPFDNFNTQKWYLEKANYQLGDINMDGLIDSTDQELILNYALGISSATETGGFLADMDSNDTIDITDVQLLQEKVAIFSK